MENIKPKLPCPYPWMHHVITTGGNTLPCCHVAATDDKTWATNDFTKGLHTPKFEEIRNDLTNGVWPKICGTCEKRESDGIKSPRHYAIEKYDTFSYQTVALKTLDVKFTNTCNLMCRMCFPGSSSLIEKFYTIHERPAFMQPPSLINYKASEKVKYVKNAIKNGLDLLKVTGGEPFACKYFVEIINWCIQNGYEKNLTLSLVTNGTKFSKTILNKLVKFKKLKIVVSIDGTGPTYEYIRHGAKWKTLCKNMENVLELKRNTTTDISLSVNCTLQTYNLHNIVDLAKVVNEWGIELYVSTNLLPKDSELSIKWLPDLLVNPVIEEINSLKGINIEFNSPDVINYLTKNRNFNIEKCKILLSTTLLYDKQRNENYKHGLHPQLVKFLDSISEK